MMHSLLNIASALWMGMAMQSRSHVVTMSEFQFKPAVVHASVGDTIVWKNSDIVPHTAQADDGSWDTKHIAAKQQQITVVKKQGTQEFTCLYHSNMKGKLVVK
jgi:plastocyanin